MIPLCLRCKRTSDVMVLGDWYPPIALCPECAADASAVPQEGDQQ